MPVKHGVEVAVSTARSRAREGQALRSRGAGLLLRVWMAQPLRTCGQGPGWAFHLSPWADAIPPCLHLAGSPRPGLGARTRRQVLLRGPPPPPGHDITHWNWHNPQGRLCSSYGSIPQPRPRRWAPWGLGHAGQAAGMQTTCGWHVHCHCPHTAPESWAMGRRRESPTGRDDLSGVLPWYPSDSVRDQGQSCPSSRLPHSSVVSLAENDREDIQRINSRTPAWLGDH